MLLSERDSNCLQRDSESELEDESNVNINVVPCICPTLSIFSRSQKELAVVLRAPDGEHFVFFMNIKLKRPRVLQDLRCA